MVVSGPRPPTDTGPLDPDGTELPVVDDSLISENRIEDNCFEDNLFTTFFSLLGFTPPAGP